MIRHFRTHKILSAVAGVLALLLSAGPAVAQTYFWWQIVDERNEPYTGENVQCSVWRPNVHAAIVLHAGSAGPGLSSGITSPLWGDTIGKFHFWSSLNTPVDVTCWYNFGGGGFAGRIDRETHKIVLPRQGTQISRFAVNSTAATYQTNSGIVIPQGGLIRDVIIQNLAPRGLGTYHLTVGFLGDHSVATANSLVSTQALTSPDEWLHPHLVASAGLPPTGSGTHRGTALGIFHAQVYAGASGTGTALYREIPYLVHVATGLQVSYSAQPGTAAAVRAHVFIIWDRLHSAANSLPFRTLGVPGGP